MTRAAAVAGGGDGIRPSLAELIALRERVPRAALARTGQHGSAGPAPSMLRGRGMEYAESREYVVGDDARHIDWRLTARSGRTHTKLFQAERERLSLLVADTAPTLYFGTRVRFKSVQAARAGAVAAWWAQRQGDRVAALRGSTVEAPVPPSGGARGVLRVLDALHRWYSGPPADDAGLSFALERAARIVRPGARVVVLADPRGAVKVPQSTWSALGRHQEVIVVLLTDPLELDPPAAELSFIAGGQRVEVDLQAQAGREHWQRSFGEPLRQLCQSLPGRRIAVHVLACDQDSDAWLAPAVAGAHV